MDLSQVIGEARRRFAGFSSDSKVTELERARVPRPEPVPEGVEEWTVTVKMEEIAEGLSIGYARVLDTLVIVRG